MGKSIASTIRAKASCTAFQAYPICRAIVRTVSSSQFPQTARQNGSKIYCCVVSRRHPTSCFKSDNSCPKRTEQVDAHEIQSEPASLWSSEVAFVITLVVTAAAGGPALAAWGVFFLILGKSTGTPHWLQAISTFLFASITDTLTYNWATVSLDTGYTPFLVFAFASGTAALYESDSWLPSESKLGSLRTELTKVILPEAQDTKVPYNHNNENRTVSNEDNEFANWDHAFRKVHRYEDADH